MGSVLAALVVLLFLGNLRSTIIAAISIPTSIIATFGLIWYMGFTLNMLTMLALTLSVGIVIDDAIVVLENIYRFIEEKGMPPMQAAVEATREIGLAVLATTLSLVAIFVPVGFMSGMVGPLHEELRADHGVRDHGVAASSASRLTPMMSSRWLKVKRRTETRRTTTRLEALEGLRPARPRHMPRHARMVDGPPRDGRRGGRARAALERAALPVRQRQLHHAGRSVGLRRQPCARSEARASRRPR